MSGRSSELFSEGKGWFDGASLGILVGSWGSGEGSDDVLIVGNEGGEAGVVEFGADFVGVRVW